MKANTHYKELSLIVGVLVAALVVITLWMSGFQRKTKATGALLKPAIVVQYNPVEIIRRNIRTQL